MVVLEYTPDHVLVLVWLKLTTVGRVAGHIATGADEGLGRVLRADVVVLEPFPALATRALRRIFVATWDELATHCRFVGELEPSYVAWSRQRFELEFRSKSRTIIARLFHSYQFRCHFTDDLLPRFLSLWLRTCIL